MMPNQTSTMFSQDPEVGLKWTSITLLLKRTNAAVRALAASQLRTPIRLWVA
jgi:hypothetical protein